MCAAVLRTALPTYSYIHARTWALAAWCGLSGSWAVGWQPGHSSLRVISSRDSSGESEAYRGRACTGDGTVPGAAALGGYA